MNNEEIKKLKEIYNNKDYRGCIAAILSEQNKNTVNTVIAMKDLKESAIKSLDDFKEKLKNYVENHSIYQRSVDDLLDTKIFKEEELSTIAPGLDKFYFKDKDLVTLRASLLNKVDLLRSNYTLEIIKKKNNKVFNFSYHKNEKDACDYLIKPYIKEDNENTI